MGGLLRHIDLALAQALQQVVGRQVDQLDLVGLLDDAVGHRFADHDAGDLGHDVVEAFEVLDVDGGGDVDPGGEQFVDVLPALGMARALGVGMRQLVQQDQLWPPNERRVDIELAQQRAAVLDLARRQALQAVEQRLGLGAAVRLNPADHHVDALGAALLRLLQHRIRLADAGGHAEEHLQHAARLACLGSLDALQQLVGIGADFGHSLGSKVEGHRLKVFLLVG